MNINRKIFWNAYHDRFDSYGETTQATVDALEIILGKFESEKRLKNIGQFAYVLATAYHESGLKGNHFVPVKEGRERIDSPRRANQDRYWKGGFYGRGLAQVTHEPNYRKVGVLLGVGDLFVENPDLLLQVEWAYEALVAGMVKGIYRKDKLGRQTLDRYFPSANSNTWKPIEAREIINGDKKKNGLLIAHYFEKFAACLRAAQTPNKFEQTISAAEAIPPPSRLTAEQSINNTVSSSNQSAENSEHHHSPSADNSLVFGEEDAQSSVQTNSKTVAVAAASGDSSAAAAVIIPKDDAPAGDAPKDEPSIFFGIEDWKPRVVRWLKQVWASLTVGNLTQGIVNAIAAIRDSENLWIYVGVFLFVLIASFIFCLIATGIILAIFHFNRREIVHFKTEEIRAKTDPNRFNFGLNIEKKV